MENLWNINPYEEMEWKLFLGAYQNMRYCAVIDGWLVFDVTMNEI